MYKRVVMQERGKDMKYTVVLTIACALLFSSFEFAKADEVSDLKKQLEQLQKKIEALEKKQAEQAKENEKVSKSVDKLKKQPSAREIVSDALGKQTTVGGHLKFFLADQSRGEVSTDTLDNKNQHNSFSAGVSDLWLFFNKQLSDWLSISVAPQLHVEATSTVRPQPTWMLKSTGPI